MLSACHLYFPLELDKWDPVVYTSVSCVCLVNARIPGEEDPGWRGPTESSPGLAREPDLQLENSSTRQ